MSDADQDKGQQENGEKPFIESKLIPMMREAVETVQVVLFSRLKQCYAKEYPELSAKEQARLSGAVVSDLFGTPSTDPENRAFVKENFFLIEEKLKCVAEEIEDLLGIVTDALRMQVICDNQEGVNTLPTLLRAKAVGVLQEERVLPMPSTFMLAVRTLGSEIGVLEQMKVTPPDEDQPM